MVSTTFVTPSPYHFDLSSDLNCRCERLSVCVSGSCLATMATRSPESFFLLILFFPSPSCAVILSHWLAVTQSLSLCCCWCSYAAAVCLSHTGSLSHLLTSPPLLVPFEISGCSWHKIAVSIPAELYEHYFPSKETTRIWTRLLEFFKHLHLVSGVKSPILHTLSNLFFFSSRTSEEQSHTISCPQKVPWISWKQHI